MPIDNGADGDDAEGEEDLYTLRFGSFLQELEEQAFRDAATFGMLCLIFFSAMKHSHHRCCRETIMGCA